MLFFQLPFFRNLIVLFICFVFVFVLLFNFSSVHFYKLEKKNLYVMFLIEEKS